MLHPAARQPPLAGDMVATHAGDILASAYKRNVSTFHGKAEDAMDCASARRALTPMPSRGIDVPMAKDAIDCAQRRKPAKRTMSRRATAPSNARRALDCEEASQETSDLQSHKPDHRQRKLWTAQKVPSEHRSP